jgi:hypothetical protein
MIRAIQFSNKRVGSTFLQNAINSHSDIMGIDEVFVNVARQGIRKSDFVPFVNSDIVNAGDYIEEVINKTYPDKNTIFKLMYNQIVDNHKGLLRYIIQNKIPIIHVMRKNLVKQVISFLKMAEYNDNPIEITPEELFKQVEIADKLNEYWSNKLKDNIKLTLYYEDMIGKCLLPTYVSNNANIAICRFFNVEESVLSATTGKKNKRDLSVYLPNIADIRKEFNCTKYDWMLEKNKEI